MDANKKKSELDLQEERINALWARIDAREAKETELNKKIEELKPTVNSFEEAIKTVITDAETASKNIKTLEEAFAKKNEELQESVKPFSNLLTDIKTSYEDFFSKPDATIQSKAEKLADHHSTIQKFEQSSLALKNEIEGFRDYIFGNEEAKVGGFKQEAEALVKTNKTLMDSWATSYSALNEKINGLLPGGTSTGLATAYQNQRLSYKWPVIIWSSAFVLTLIGMIWFAIYNYKEVTNFKQSINYIMARLPFFAVSIWLATFIGKRLNQNMRLMQEYSFKEALAKSYEGYKKEIEKLADEDAKAILIKKQLETMVEMFGFNPSQTLESHSHNEEPAFYRFFGRRGLKKQEPTTGE